MSWRKAIRRRLSALGIFVELWHFMLVSKKWWLGPIIVVLLLLAVLIMMTAGTPIAPFIYTVF